MTIDDLRIMQAKFEPIRRARSSEYEASVTLRLEFLRRFPPNSIGDLSLKSYAIGDGDKGSFCYWVERETRSLGSILGATALKFRVYFDKDAGSYVYQQKYESAEAALKHTKELITALIFDVSKKNWESVDVNPLSPMFKAKVLSLYFPDSFAPIFADSHLDHFLRHLGLPTNGLSNIQKNLALTELRASDVVMANWSPYEFMDFLYESFGGPGEKAVGMVPGPLRNYLDSEDDFMDPKKTTIDLLAASIDKPLGSRNFGHAENGFALGQRIAAEEAGRRGLQGELLVLKFERERLVSLGKEALATKVEHTAAINPRAGYDVASYNEDGSPRCIEVKATVGSASGETSFILTRNEYEAAKRTTAEGGSFYLYRIFLVKSATPKILCIKFSDLDRNSRIEPLVFEVAFTIQSSVVRR